MKKILLGLSVLAFAGAGCAGGAAVTSFAECVAAGYPVAESYPRQCAADGVVYVEDVGNTLEMTDLIRVNAPTPNSTVTSPLTITGEARGTWFFEASFPVEMQDEDGNVLGQGYAEATEDWMTEDFVPFTATLTFTIPVGVTEGVLYLRKDNPSGLPERDNEMHFPVQFE